MIVKSNRRPSGKNDGNGLGLDGRRRVIVGALQRLQDGRGETEVGELRQLSIFLATAQEGRADIVSMHGNQGAASC